MNIKPNYQKLSTENNSDSAQEDYIIDNESAKTSKNIDSIIDIELKKETDSINPFFDEIYTLRDNDWNSIAEFKLHIVDDEIEIEYETKEWERNKWYATYWLKLLVKELLLRDSVNQLTLVIKENPISEKVAISAGFYNDFRENYWNKWKIYRLRKSQQKETNYKKS